MEKIATATYSFEKLRRAGYVYVDKTDMARTDMARTAAVSAAGAGQGRARYHAAVETTAVRSKAGAGQAAGTLPCCRRDDGSTEQGRRWPGGGHVTTPAAETAAVRRRPRRYGIGQYGATTDFF